MRASLPTFPLVAVLLAACGDAGTNPASAQEGAPSSKTFVEGKDYTVMERVRFMDNHGFERPAEAFSVLLPKGWKHEGGIQWKDMNECRGEMVTGRWSASSPDGAIRFASLPLHTWGSASDPMMRQSMMMGAQSGGCEYGGAMPAEQYLREVFGPRELQGATITEVKENKAAKSEMDQQSQRTKAAAEQYGGMVEVLNSAVVARLKWSDGTEGIALANVMNMITTTQDMYSGTMNQFTTSMSSERSFLRFPTARKDEAERFLANAKSSFRTNPEWKRAIDDFFVRMRGQQDVMHRQKMAAIDAQTRANTAAHNQRMSAIQQQGTANTQRHNERMANMDSQMRSWESQQSSQDRIHKSFVQTIREVQTYQDGNGKVELSSGYDQAWSRGDGTYILSNSPSFDPSSVFQDQNWQEMKPTNP